MIDQLPRIVIKSVQQWGTPHAIPPPPQGNFGEGNQIGKIRGGDYQVGCNYIHPWKYVNFFWQLCLNSLVALYNINLIYLNRETKRKKITSHKHENSAIRICTPFRPVSGFRAYFRYAIFFFFFFNQNKRTYNETRSVNNLIHK